MDTPRLINDPEKGLYYSDNPNPPPYKPWKPSDWHQLVNVDLGDIDERL